MKLKSTLSRTCFNPSVDSVVSVVVVDGSTVLLLTAAARVTSLEDIDAGAERRGEGVTGVAVDTLAFADTAGAATDVFPSASRVPLLLELGSLYLSSTLLLDDDATPVLLDDDESVVVLLNF